MVFRNQKKSAMVKFKKYILFYIYVKFLKFIWKNEITVKKILIENVSYWLKYLQPIESNSLKV